jgi:hypothetical protein
LDSVEIFPNQPAWSGIGHLESGSNIAPILGINQTPVSGPPATFDKTHKFKTSSAAMARRAADILSFAAR